MKTTTPPLAVHFAASAEDAGQILPFLHSHGLTGIADANVRPRITVAGIGQEALSELVRGWQRRCFAERLAAERREKESANGRS